MGPLKIKMQGLKGNPADDEETRKGQSVPLYFARVLYLPLNSYIPKYITARQNERLREWLADNGVWMTDRSGWGVPPHPLGRWYLLYGFWGLGLRFVDASV